MSIVLTETMETQTWESGLATAEYAVATIAAVGFAGLLIAILKSDGVHAALENIITTALTLAKLMETDVTEKGAITAELATTLPAVMMLLAVVIALAAAFGTQFRVSDAARTGARLRAIGVDQSQVIETVTAIVGGTPNVGFPDTGEGWATVKVEQSIRVGPFWLGPLTVNATATSWKEP